MGYLIINKITFSDPCWRQSIDILFLLHIIGGLWKMEIEDYFYLLLFGGYERWRLKIIFNRKNLTNPCWR